MSTGGLELPDGSPGTLTHERGYHSTLPEISTPTRPFLSTCKHNHLWTTDHTETSKQQRLPRREFAATLEMMKEKKRVGEEATLAGSDGDDDEVPEVDWLSAGALLYMPKPQVRFEKLQYVL